MSRTSDRPEPSTVALDAGALVAHDIRHELSTIAMLASALRHSGDVGDVGRRLATQLVDEIHRLDELTSALLTASSAEPAPRSGTYPEIRLDELVRSVVEPIRMTSHADIHVLTTAVVVRHDRVVLWRAIRNVLCNALAAVDMTGRINVRLFVQDRCAILDIDDDGPGMSDEQPRADAKGLRIIATLAVGWGGWFEVGTSSLGGCRVRLVIPLSPNVG